MAFSRGIPYGGEAGDVRAEVAANNDTHPPQVDVTAPRAVTGAFGLLFHLDVTSAIAAIDTGRTTSAGLVAVYSCYVSVGAAPSEDLALLSQGARVTGQYYPNPGTTKKLIAITPGLKLQAYDKNGIARGPASTASISTTTSEEVVIVIDALTLSTVWIAIYAGGAWEGFDTGLAPADFYDLGVPTWWGESLNTGESRNADLYLDNLYAADTSTAGDAPHTTAYPRVLVAGGDVPTANGFYNPGSWSILGTSPPANKWEAVDEAPGNDTVDFIQTTTSGARQSFTYTGNPLPGGATIIEGKIGVVQNIVGAAKSGATGFLRLGGVDLDLTWLVNPTPTDEWIGLGTANLAIQRPGGGSWAQADLTGLEFGQMGAAVGSCLSQITVMRGPQWAYYTATLSTSPTPTTGSAVLPTPRQTKAAAGVLVRPTYDHAGMIRNATLRDIDEVRRSVERSVRA